MITPDAIREKGRTPEQMIAPLERLSKAYITRLDDPPSASVFDGCFQAMISMEEAEAAHFAIGYFRGVGSRLKYLEARCTDLETRVYNLQRTNDELRGQNRSLAERFGEMLALVPVWMQSLFCH